MWDKDQRAVAKERDHALVMLAVDSRPSKSIKFGAMTAALVVNKADMQKVVDLAISLAKSRAKRKKAPTVRPGK